MGLSKQYLKYLPLSQFGVIGSSICNVVFLSLRGTNSRYVAAGSCEHVNIWDIKSNCKVMVLQGERAAATVLAASPDGQHLSVGYSNGSIKVFSLLTSEILVTYNGHKSGVSSLAYESDGLRLASGANDTEVIVWDLVNESGLHKLRGHKDQITCCTFVSGKNFLVTSSKDSLVKWWDLDTQHCFKTIAGHKAEVWGFLISNKQDFIVTGSSDSSLRVWKLNYSDNDGINAEKLQKEGLEDGVDDEESTIYSTKVFSKNIGSVMRTETDRVVSLRQSPDGRLLACHGRGKCIELFRVRNEEEVKNYQKKRLKKLKKKMEESEDVFNDNIAGTELEKQCSRDMFTHIGKFRTPGKVRSIDVSKESGSYFIICLLQNNQIVVKSIDTELQQSDLITTSKVSMAGHRNMSKCLSFTSDGLGLLTTSANSVKLWNRVSQQCIQTCETDYASSSMFIPGDRQFLVGTVKGSLEIHDIPSGKCVETIESAHDDAITSMVLYSGKKGCASCSKDKSVKFWNFDLMLDVDFSKTTKRLTLTHTRTLKLDEEISVIEFSPNGKLIACALLNCTVQLFFVDSLKFFLSLYGHSLPVTCLSISDDSTLIATGSSDRNIKVWGLDFGDCHKSIFAHDNNITGVKFVPDTHLFFSSGRDGDIKQWDGDKFIHIQTLKGHIGGVSSIALDGQGDFLLSCGSDMSLRLWSRSNEIVIPEEEQEQAREEEDNERLVKNLAPSVLAEDGEVESPRVTKPTIQSVKGAESIMEALELHKEEGCKPQNNDTQKHPLLVAHGNISSKRYVLETLRKVRSSELEESLLVLPFSYIPSFLKLLNQYISYGWEVELSCRCLLFLLKSHYKLISTNDELLPIIEHLQENSELRVQDLQNAIGFNLAYLSHLKRELEAKDEVTFFEDATENFQQRKKRRKKKEHALLTV